MNTSTFPSLAGAFQRLIRPLGSFGRVVLVEPPGAPQMMTRDEDPYQNDYVIDGW